MEFSPKQLFKNQFVIRHHEKYIPHFSEIIDTYPDKSIKKARLIWVADDIQPHEIRNYQILAYSRGISRPKYIKKIGNDFLVDSGKNLKFLISSNGLSQIHNQSKILLIQDFTQIISEEGVIHCSIKQQKSQILLRQQNDFCSQIEVIGAIDSTYKYSQYYTIFHQISMILCKKNIHFQKDNTIQLAEIQTLNFHKLPNGLTTFYGWKKQSTLIKSFMDIYDYQIAQNPDSYLFLKYLNDEINDIKYHFVERRKTDQRRNNLLATTQIDSALSVSLSIPNGQWKRHSTFHIARDSSTTHLSWHWHGFQRKEHWNRFYRQIWNEFWPADSSRTFQSLYFFHSPEISDKNLQELLNNYINLTYYFK